MNPLFQEFLYAFVIAAMFEVYRYISNKNEVEKELFKLVKHMLDNKINEEKEKTNPDSKRTRARRRQ